MKINNVEKEVKEFQPVTLNVTFQTQEELEAFWHRMNMGSYCFKEYGQKEDVPHFADGRMAGILWKWTDQQLKRQGIDLDA